MEECILLMQKHKVGSLLVVRDNAKRDLIGIFTERDLLRKIEVIDKGGFWDKPVRKMMTYPIRVIQADQLHQAADIMVKYGIRHLPIVVTDDEQKNRLVGVISMRDIFVNMVQSQAKAKAAEELEGKKARTKIPPIGVVTADLFFVQFLRDTLSSVYRIGVQHLAVEDVLDEVVNPQILVFDLDGMASTQWIKSLKALNKRMRPPMTAIVYDPALYETDTVRALKKLESSKEFVVFPKPLSITGLLNRIGPVLGLQPQSG